LYVRPKNTHKHTRTGARTWTRERKGVHPVQFELRSDALQPCLQLINPVLLIALALAFLGIDHESVKVA
jgi:hypothetical protein